MERDQDSYALPLLLSILKDKNHGSSITSLVNATTIDLMYKLFSREDYHSFAVQLNASDAKNLLDFILQLLHDPRLTNLNGTVDIKQRARRFMLKVITKTPVIPESLIVTGISIPAEHDYIVRGGFGDVFKGELRGDVVAVKVLYKAEDNVAFCQEALMWGSLNHEFVLPFLGLYQDEPREKLFLVSPYTKNGTLAQWRREKNPSIATVEERILEVAKGIQYIHSEGVVHGDLRGANVLLDANLHAQIADFGLTRISEATNTRSGALRVNFAAPELFGIDEDEDFEPIRTQKSDVYAFGCLYYEIHYDVAPFAGKTEIMILKLHARGSHPRRLQEPPLSDKAWELIRSCWAREASNRPGIEEVMAKMAAMSQSVVSTLARPPARSVQPKEDAMELATMYSTPMPSFPDSPSRNSPCFHIPHFSESPAQASSPSTSAFKTPSSSFAPSPPTISRRSSRLSLEQRTGLAITAHDPPYETPLGAPWTALASSTAPLSNEKDLSATLEAKLEDYCSPDCSNIESFPATQQSDENTDVLTVWQNVTLDPQFKNADLYTLYGELMSRARYDGTKLVLKTDDVLHINLAFTILRGSSRQTSIEDGG